MAKDEKKWIPDNYYNGFLRGCLANELIETTPAKSVLEDAGCEISALCYLILPDGSQHNPRFMKPNEFPTSIRKLFEIEAANFDLDYGPLEPNTIDTSNEPAVTDRKPISDMLADITSKVCNECKQPKPIEAFAKMRGRGVRRQDVCIECNAKTKEKKPDHTTSDNGDLPVAPYHEIPRGQPTPTVKTGPMAVVSVDYLKKIANEAFNRGREYERSNINTVAPSLDELLEIGA